MSETIFALSSGLPPAGIAIVRVSGPFASTAFVQLAGKLPLARRAVRCRFRDAKGAVLDEGLGIWFPGPGSATGENLAEFHLHGGRAVVAAVLAALARLPGFREAQAGEFTRRAFENGRIDLTEAEGLADLLAAETESQRRAALVLAEGGLGRLVDGWQADTLKAAALVEAELDLSDEDDVGASGAGFRAVVAPVMAAVRSMLESPPAERLRDGVRVVLAGPPNAGKSSLFNALIGRDAAIVTEIAGTTRDKIEAPVVIDGVPLLLIDTAGLHEGADDPVERIGIERTSAALAMADIILWLGAEDELPDGAILIAAKSDAALGQRGLAVSAKTGDGLTALRAAIVQQARALLPVEGALALNARHRALLAALLDALNAAMKADDLLIVAEYLRMARASLDRITGRAGVEDMLDALFGAFCVGK